MDALKTPSTSLYKIAMAIKTAPPKLKKEVRLLIYRFRRHEDSFRDTFSQDQRTLYEKRFPGYEAWHLLNCLEEVFLDISRGKFSSDVDPYGAILEIIVESYVRDRYSDRGCCFDTNCTVYLDGELIKYHSKKTVDIAGWNSNNEEGEAYECKFTWGAVQLDNIGLLNRLYEKFNALKDGSLVVGIVTFEVEPGESRLSQMKYCHEKLKLISLTSLDSLASVQRVRAASTA